MQQYSTAWIFGFAFLICLVCSLLVSLAAVSLHERQETNKRAHKLNSVLEAGHLVEPGAALSAQEIDAYFQAPEEGVEQEKPVIESHVVDLTADVETGEDPASFDETTVAQLELEANSAGLKEIPEKRLVFFVKRGGEVDQVILPVEGKGLWSTLHGYIALEPDLNTVKGLTYYDHGETPGLGGEVDNPRWKSNWVGREIYEDGEVAVEVIKGSAPPAEEAPHKVDGLSGATLTSRGVSNMMHFWFGENGYGPYLDKLREQLQTG
ncbi:MAG: Na(+)-translocating NADH-quinone reductase subunit C [Candidatus Hydrogenedentota bacterium]